MIAVWMQSIIFGPLFYKTNNVSRIMTTETPEERRAIDPVFKQIVEEEFAAYNVACQTEYEVGRLPRTIDAFVTVADEMVRQKIRTETPFLYLSKDNQIEFKGRGDRLTTDGYTKIRGRMEFLLSDKHVSPSTMTVTIISAGEPRTIYAYARDERKRPFVATGEKGYYKTDEQPPIYLIVINKLPIIPKNYPLLIFASNRQKFRQSLEQMIVAGEHTYIRYAYEVRPQVTKEVLTMAGITTALSREDLEFMAHDIGPELAPFLKAEDLLKGMNPEEQRKLLLSLLSADNLLAETTVETLLNEISTTNRERLMALLATLQVSAN